ncbi:MAG: DoxX family protein [Candidatus Absconditabacterales bacterium]|nr:DoxX family protein [Candidatus Absconditabacterales bacterium]
MIQRLITTRKTSSGLTRIITVIRIILGTMMISYGYSKFFAGPERRAVLGENMAMLGITEGFVIWGFLAAFAEFVGGMLLILGLFTRAAASMISFTFVIILIVQGQRLGANPERLFALTKFIEILFYLYSSTYFVIKGSGPLSLDTRFGLCLIDKRCKK